MLIGSLIRNINKGLRSNLISSNRSTFRCYSTDQPAESDKLNKQSDEDEQDKSNESKLVESSQSSSTNDSLDDLSFKLSLYPDPNLCCREGCENCIYIQYANELEKHFKNSSMALKEVEKQIDDPSVRQFIIMQIKNSRKN